MFGGLAALCWFDVYVGFHFCFLFDCGLFTFVYGCDNWFDLADLSGCASLWWFCCLGVLFCCYFDWC